MVNAQDFGFNHANAIGEIGFKDGELFCAVKSMSSKRYEELIAIANEKESIKTGYVV